MIDEASVLLSSRMVAFMLEPRRPAAQELLDLADGLDLATKVCDTFTPTAVLQGHQL